MPTIKKNLKYFALLFLFLAWFVLFHKVFLKGLLPIPADIITGVYFPWLDYKWGFLTGVPVKNPLISDIPSLLYPWRQLVIDQYASGSWPLWNPYYFGGMPLLANFQSAAFSYVNAFFLFLPKAFAWSFGVMLSPLITMLAFYIFLRNKKLGVMPSLLGSITFSLSGFQTAWLEYNVHGHTALFLPLLLLFIDKILGENKRRYLFGLPLLVAFQIFAGYIPVVIYSYLICGFYVLFFYLIPELKKSFEYKKFLLFFGFFLWGIFLASVQLFPGFELTQNSIRKIDPTVTASNASYLPFVNLATALAPDFFGNPATGNYFGTAFYDNFYFFMGTGTLILLFFSLFFLKKEKNIFFWWTVLGFSFILIFENPLGKILEKILFLSGGVSARALFMTTFSLAVLFAYGFEKMLSETRARKKLLFSIFILFALFLLTYLISNQIKNPVFKSVAQRNLVIPFAAFAFSGFCLFLLSFKKLKKYKYFFAFVFCLITLAQLIYSTQKYLPFSKKELLFPKTPVLDFLVGKQKLEKSPFRVELGEVIPQNFLMPYKLQTISGYDALMPKRTGEFLSLLKTGEVKENISRVFLIDGFDSNLYPILNINYVLAKKTDEKGFFSPSGSPPAVFANPRFKAVFEDKTVVVYEDQKALPRAFWVYDFAVAEDDLGLINLLKTSDLSKKVILEEKPEIEPILENIVPGSVVWSEYLPNKVSFVAESEKPGIIFLSDNFYPGWVAFIDGQKAKILRANYTFRALSVPEGKHRIDFEYKPKSFYLGLGVSLASFVIYGLFLLREVIKLKKSQVKNDY